MLPSVCSKKILRCLSCDWKYFRTAVKQLQKKKNTQKNNLNSTDMNENTSYKKYKLEQEPDLCENNIVKTVVSEFRHGKNVLFKQPKTEIIFGIHPVYLALQKRKRKIYRIYIKSDTAQFTDVNASKKKAIELEALDSSLPIIHTNTNGIRKLVSASAVHQGVCLEVSPYPLMEWTEDLHISLDGVDDDKNSNPLWLVLYEILDPMNVGAIIRTAHYFGVGALFMLKDNCCKLSPTVSKASSGALEIMNIYKLSNLVEFLKARGSEGWNIVSTVAYNEEQTDIPEPLIDAHQLHIPRPTILILGNEGKGIPSEIHSLCRSFMSIRPHSPLHQGIDSLNVSVAAGIILHTLSQARQKLPD